jgi:uncharacterized membrane protein
MNVFEFVIAIVVLSFVYRLMVAWIRERANSRSSGDEPAKAALLERLGQLEERVQVLERIVTDERFELKQQFKDLAR